MALASEGRKVILSRAVRTLAMPMGDIVSAMVLVLLMFVRLLDIGTTRPRRLGGTRLEWEECGLRKAELRS